MSSPSLFKVLSSLFCSTFLLYQFSQLLAQYISGKTVVNIEVKREIYENLPAITICLPQIVLIEALANYNQDYQIDYENYNVMLSKKYFSNLTLYNKIKQNLTDVFSKGILFLLNNMNHKEFFDIIENISLPYDQQYLNLNIDGNLQGKSIIGLL